MSANKTTFLASVLAHGLLFTLLTPWLTVVEGDVPPVAEVRSSLVTPTELVPEPPTVPDRLPPPPEDIPPPGPADDVPPEEMTAESPIFDRPVDPDLTTAFEIPRERSIAVRSARNRRREPAPLAASAPPPVKTVPVSSPVPRVSGPTRKAMPKKDNPPPDYPARAVERSLEGVVLVAAHVDRDGAVVRVEILTSSGYALLDREALRAVGTWRFSPALEDGVAIASRIEVPIRFRIS